ncbi:polysaccharide pyruvyl transferase family protein, partial [Acinetobacter soli]|uniref:polysaccharide pyruvyl transferase family protein n=1 Tax=Acinetobacter soli TaxID=487316 RepID=UPI00148CB3B2
MNSEKFVIVNAYGRSNRGDSVLLDECLDEIKSSKKNVNLHCIIFDDKDFSNQIDSDVTWSFRIGNTVSNGILAKIITMLFLLISVLATFKFFQWLIYLLPQSQRLSWKKIYQSDYVISAPGGYIHDTNFAYYIALMHIWLGVRFKKKVILAPQSIGPIDGSFSKKICQFVLKEVDVICARESYTYNFLINELFLEESKVFKTGDSAFWNFNVIKNKEYIQKTFEDIKISNLENN